MTINQSGMTKNGTILCNTHLRFLKTDGIRNAETYIMLPMSLIHLHSGIPIILCIVFSALNNLFVSHIHKYDDRNTENRHCYDEIYLIGYTMNVSQ